MAYEFRLQDPGEGIHEAEIVKVLVREGDRVKEGDDVLVAETDKAAVDIPSPVSGEIVDIKVAEGDVVEVGNVLMEIQEEGTAGQRSDKAEERENHAAEPREREKKELETADDDESEQEAKRKPASEGKVSGTTPRKEVDEDKEETGTHDKEERREEFTDADNAAGAPATPAVRGLARELGVDIESLSGSGEDGRVTEDDVRSAAKGPSETEMESERFKLRSLRRSTAKRMADSWREIPHVTHQDVVDITEIEGLRREQAAKVEERGGKLTLTPFLMKAIVGALREHPRFNARFDAESMEVEVFKTVNIGVALDTDRGLLVPVVRDVERKSVYDLAVELVELAERLQRERPDPGTLRGGTFTLTNVGSIGGTGLSPLINPPQVAIFGAARAELRQVIRGDLDDATAETRLMLPVCVTFDHRVNDGADAARFMNGVKQLLANPDDFALRS